MDTIKNNLTIDEFRREYLDAFKRMMSYSSDQVGSRFYMDIMVSLAEAYPDFAEQVENE
jgi:hypothetical protein